MRHACSVLGAITLLCVCAAYDGAKAQRATVVGSCVFSSGVGTCVRQYSFGESGPAGIQSIKEPSEEVLADQREREKLWLARCRPLIRQDAFGVSRYSYAAPGCEFGQFGD